MPTEHYKAVRLDKTSHYDGATEWRAGRIVRALDVDSKEVGSCGRGIHSSPTLLDAVSYQRGPSLYCLVEPRGIIAADKTKTRSECVKVIRWIGREEQDELSCMRLWEANHPINPLLVRRQGPVTPQELEWLIAWASVWASVGASVWASVWAYTGSLFPGISSWKYITAQYPWEPIRQLWLAGLAPSYDGKLWRLHAGPRAEVVWSGTL